MFYGTQAWDPALIIAQIVTIQCVFYFSISVIDYFALSQMVKPVTLDYIFDWRKLALKNMAGALTALTHLLTAALTSIYIVHIVERSKKCLDFSATVYILHFLFCCVYAGIPHNVEWWATNSLGLGLMALLSEWMCIRREMQEIPLSTFRYRNSSPLQATRLQQITTLSS